MGLTRAAGLPSPPLRLAPASGREEEAAPLASLSSTPEPQGRAPRSRSRARPTRARSHPPGSGRRVLPPPRRFPPAPPRRGAALLRLAAPLGPPPARLRAPLRAALLERHRRPVARAPGVGHFVASPGLRLREAAGVNSLLSGLVKVFPKCWQWTLKSRIKHGSRWFRGTSAAQKVCGSCTAPKQLCEAFLKPYKST